MAQASGVDAGSGTLVPWSPGDGHAKAERSAGLVRGKTARSLVPPWSHVDYARFTDLYFGPDQSQLTLDLTFGPWCFQQSDVTRQAVLRSVPWVRSLIEQGHTSAVMHGPRLEAAMLMFLNRPAESWRAGGAKTTEVASKFVQHMMLILCTFRRIKSENDAFEKRGRYPKTNPLRRQMSPEENTLIMDVCKNIAD